MNTYQQRSGLADLKRGADVDLGYKRTADTMHVRESNAAHAPRVVHTDELSALMMNWVAQGNPARP